MKPQIMRKYLHALLSFRLITGVCLGLLISINSQHSFSQNTLDLQQILDKHATATGLYQRIKVKTLISYGVIEQLGHSLDVSILQKRPAKYRMDVHFEDGRITQAFDGSAGWSLNPFIQQDTIPIDGLELEQLKESALFDGVLFNAADLGYEVSLIGEDHIVTVPSYVLLLKKDTGDRMRFYIDKQDFLIKRTEASFFLDGYNYEVNSTFSNFKEVEGMTLPFLIQNNNGQLTTKIRIQEVKVNEELKDDLFTWKK